MINDVLFQWNFVIQVEELCVSYSQVVPLLEHQLNELSIFDRPGQLTGGLITQSPINNIRRYFVLKLFH